MVRGGVSVQGIVPGALKPRRAGIVLEANTGVIEILHEDTEAIEFLIDWMYTGKISLAEDIVEPLVFYVRVYIASVFYQVSSLKEDVLASFSNLLESTRWRRPLDDDDLPAAVELIYSSTPAAERELRKAAFWSCAWSFKTYQNNQNFVEIEATDFWRDLCEEIATARELKNLFEHGLFCDLNIKSPSGKTLRMHRIIVCGFSEAFTKSLETDLVAAESTAEIQMSHADPVAVEAMLRWMYYSSCEVPKDSSDMKFLFRMWAVADFYQVPALREDLFPKSGPIFLDTWPKPEFLDALKLIPTATHKADTWLYDHVILRSITNTKI
ncbi:uncharacterized protein J3D65DRAFT_667530 [Phyllosticta citribraziliensis]|uniref:BTB domain-containing protein n=1 Tax=Phyllosticta citribraziliensis TaxID=989973 RepID=A0ABR1LNQ0_9PEZI